MMKFKHDYLPLDLQIQEVLEPIYSDLSRPELLNRCKGSNTQNNNESYNGLLWHFAPKHLHSGLKTIELANFFAVAIFNEGFQAILKAFETMGVIIGPSAKDYAEKRDMRRMMVAEKQHREASKGARTARRTAAAAQQQFFEQEEGELYGPGIAE
ncbi:uncharacterized protein LOC112588833 [Harpegnathos saltator]|uniref:uncharacterized protein LOC112588833 n=1 Tax=Harpegnathos saltator TaxID=610380 RepID=UPI000DBEE987|nr:uncharacterized protein LOC112588833 [Harpegnathos saltator]